MMVTPREAIKEVLTLGPTAEGQMNYRSAHLAQLYFTGSFSPDLSRSLHPRTHEVIRFALSHSEEELNSGGELAADAMERIRQLFPGMPTFYSVDDLCFRWILGTIQALVHPSFYNSHFAPEAAESDRTLGMMAADWHFHPYPHIFSGPKSQNELLLDQLGKYGESLLPYSRYPALFFAEVAARVLPHSRYTKNHVRVLRKVAKVGKKPRVREGGEAGRALRSIFLANGGFMDHRLQMRFIEGSEANPKPKLEQIDDEISKLRALTAKYRKQVISKRETGPVLALHSRSLFTQFAPVFLNDEMQGWIHETLR